MSRLFGPDHLVLIRGAGDLASGVALRLWRSGFPVVMTEIAAPLAVRRTVAFAQAVFDGATQVEDAAARCCAAAHVQEVLAAGEIPVIVDPRAQSCTALHPQVVVDGIMAKRNTGTRRADAPLVVGLGPGFCAGQDCHAVIETHRGHNLGRVIWQGPAQPNTGRPGTLPGLPPAASRVLRAPIAGSVTAHIAIGDRVDQGMRIATVQGGGEQDEQGEQKAVVTAPFTGVLRGIVHPSVWVKAGMKVGDLDPRADPAYCFTVSDKSLAIGGAVLEAVLVFLQRQSSL